MLTEGYEQFAHFLRSLADIPDAEMEKAAEIFRPTSFPKGAFLVRAGKVPQTLSFVVSGIVRLYYITPTGVEVTKSFRTENYFYVYPNTGTYFLIDGSLSFLPDTCFWTSMLANRGSQDRRMVVR